MCVFFTFNLFFFEIRFFYRQRRSQFAFLFVHSFGTFWSLSLSLFSFRCMPVLYSSQCVSAPILKVFSSLILSLSQRDQYIHFTIFILSLVLLLCDFQVHSILLVLVLVRLVIFVSYLGSHYNVLLLFKLERIR